MSKFGIQKKIKKKSNKNLIIVFFIEFYDFWWKLHFNRMKWSEVTDN